MIHTLHTNPTGTFGNSEENFLMPHVFKMLKICEKFLIKRIHSRLQDQQHTRSYRGKIRGKSLKIMNCTHSKLSCLRHQSETPESDAIPSTVAQDLRLTNPKTSGSWAEFCELEPCWMHAGEIDATLFV